MARTITLTTKIPACSERVWTEVQTSRLLLYVASGFIRFSPANGEAFFEKWDGETVIELKAWMWLLGFIPLGWQIMRVEPLEPIGKVRRLRDNGRGLWMRRWDHIILIEPDGENTRYTDDVTIEAGLFTAPIALFARAFYAHRQRRWVKLAKSGFCYD